MIPESFQSMNYPIHILSKVLSKNTSGSLLPLFKETIWDIIQPPEELFIQGKETSLSLLDTLPDRGLAVVGTRNPQYRSTTLTKKILQDLSASKLIIISGLARGIDTTAHWAAMEAGLPTIAVLGSGLDLNYPAENQLLREKILQSGGLVVSEFPLGTPALPHHFLRRNRLIAGWSLATWVVEASARSGALNTARWAREMNRTCFAVPCFPNDPSLEGNQMLLDRDHALALWTSQSLGATWIELSTQTPKTTQKLLLHPRSEALVQFVHTLTHQKGGASLEEGLNWASTQNWKPEEFFDTVNWAIREKHLVNFCGTLVKRN